MEGTGRRRWQGGDGRKGGDGWDGRDDDDGGDGTESGTVGTRWRNMMEEMIGRLGINKPFRFFLTLMIKEMTIKEIEETKEKVRNKDIE